MLKSSLMLPPLPSFAVTRTVIVPASPACGVPAKMRLTAVKVSQLGNAVLSDLNAV